MFTGIVEEVGVVHRIDGNQDGIEISIKAKKILDDLKVDDSVSCSGIWLTVTDVILPPVSILILRVNPLPEPPLAVLLQ